jgi:hypothetical protein
LNNRFSPAISREEARRRPLRLSSAISRFTVSWAEGKLGIQAFSDVERACLDSIRSDVESKTGDLSGTHINVTLLTQHPDISKIQCVGRTDTHRGFGQTYSKELMLAWEAMETGKVCYSPEFAAERKPYHSILCFPLMYLSDGETRSLGAVSIDHAAFHAFDDLTDELENSLSPYLRMLELALVARDRAKPKQKKDK